MKLKRCGIVFTFVCSLRPALIPSGAYANSSSIGCESAGSLFSTIVQRQLAISDYQRYVVAKSCKQADSITYKLYRDCCSTTWMISAAADPAQTEDMTFTNVFLSFLYSSSITYGSSGMLEQILGSWRCLLILIQPMEANYS